jgi:hypothetical protein
MDEKKTIRMVRDANEHPDSHEANVHADQVSDFEGWGWRRADALDHDGDGKKGGSKKKAKAADTATDPLDVPNEDAGGLTKRELHADAEALGIEIDPLGAVADLFAQVQAAKAAKTADAAPEAGGEPAPEGGPVVEGGETQTPASDA